VTGVFYPGPTAHGPVRGHLERDRRCGIVLSRIWVGRYADALFAGSGMPLILLKHCIGQQKIELALCIKSDTVHLLKIGCERLIGRCLVTLVIRIGRLSRINERRWFATIF